jgi:hypothetical protein
MPLTAAAAAVVLAGCGSTTAVQQAGGPGSAVLVSDGEDVYNKLLTDIYGTPTDRIIAEKYQHHRIQAAIADCMKGKGHAYTPPTYDGVAGGPIVPGDMDGAAPLAADFAVAATRQRAAEAAAVNTAIVNGPADPAQQGAYDQALTDCATAGEQFQESHFPSGTNELGEALLNNLTEIATISIGYPGLAEDYRTCLKQAGYAAGSWAELHQLVTDKFPTPGQPWNDVKDTPAWNTAVGYERAAATADRNCRIGLHEFTMNEMKDRAERFLREGNGGAIREVTANWDQLIADAAKAGIE